MQPAPRGILYQFLYQEVENIFISWIKSKERKKEMSLIIEQTVEDLLHAGLCTELFFFHTLLHIIFTATHVGDTVKFILEMRTCRKFP